MDILNAQAVVIMKFNTALVHSAPVSENGATIAPIYQVSAFAQESAERLEQVFNNKAPGFAYTRIGNPTVDAFEKRMSALEGGIGAVACASGMAAVTMNGAKTLTVTKRFLHMVRQNIFLVLYRCLSMQTARQKIFMRITVFTTSSTTMQDIQAIWKLPSSPQNLQLKFWVKSLITTAFW